MWRHFRTLRFKLAILYLLVFGAILTGLCLVILAVGEKNLRKDFDERLRDRAEAMAEKIAISTEEPKAKTPRRTGRFIPFRFPGYYFQLRSADGQVVERSKNLGGLTLPLSYAAGRARGRDLPIFETLRGRAAEQLIGNPGEVRLLTRYLDRPGDEAFYLQVSVNLREVNASVSNLRNLLLALVSAGLILAALASWLLAGRSLAPIGRVAEVAERLGAHDLSQRVDHLTGKDEVAEMVERVNRMLDRLEDAFESQGRFIASVSHELKTPLAVLLGSAQVLLGKDRSPAEHRRFAHSVQEEARELSQTIDSLLTLARAEAGLSLASREEVSLYEVVTDAGQRCEAAAREGMVRLITRLAPLLDSEAAPLVLGDGELLRLMVTNLLRNAIRYSPPGGTVEVHVTLPDGEARILVRDHGPGIPEEHIGFIFDQFYRVPQEDGSSKGVGLGLTIVRGVANLHGGKVTASNHSKGGCEFDIRLPRITKQGASSH